MGNSIHYEVLKNSDFKAITECIGDNPKQKRWKDHPEWGEKLLKFHAPDFNLYIGAHEGKELVGCMIAHRDTLQIKNILFNCAIIAITEVRRDYRNRGIATKMLERMLNQVKDFDLVLAFQTAGRGGVNILKRAGFYKVHKYGHASKVLDKNKMESLLDLNPVLKIIAMKLFSSEIGQAKPTRGMIREARDDEFEQVVELMNREGAKLDIASHWTKEYLKKKRDWRYKIYILEEQGDILASVIRYEEISVLGENEFTCGFLKDLAFREELEDDEKQIFINNVLDRFKGDGIPNVMYPTPKPWQKILKRTGFRTLPGDERSVFIKPLSTNLKDVLEKIEKIRNVNVFLIC